MENHGPVQDKVHGAETLDSLMEAYGSDVLKICLMYLRNRSLAEDAFQDTFIKVMGKLDQIESIENIKAWVMRISVNVCKDMLKGFWWRKVMKSTPAEGFREPSSGLDLGALAVGRLHRAERKKAVFDQVQALPERFREVVILYYFQDCDTQGIARMLDLPEGTVRSRLHRARQILQGKLKGWMDQNESNEP